MKYSVITPAYNAEKYVLKYLRMFTDIEYGNYELVVVDDCSSDETYNILMNNKDSCPFKLLVAQNPQNGGAGIARNLGLDMATGEYIFFVDIDDEVSSDIFSSLDSALEASDADCVLFDSMIVDLENEKTHILKSMSACLAEGEVEGMGKMEVIAYSTGSVCGKVYKRSICKNFTVSFPAERRFEDMAFNKIMLSHCENILYLHKCLYRYIQHGTSTVHAVQKGAYKYAIASFQYAVDRISRELHSYLVPQFMSDVIYFCSINMIESGCDNQTIKNVIGKCIESFDMYNAYKGDYKSCLPLYVKLSCTFYDLKFFGLLRIMTWIRKKMK